MNFEIEPSYGTGVSMFSSPKNTSSFLEIVRNLFTMLILVQGDGVIRASCEFWEITDD